MQISLSNIFDYSLLILEEFMDLNHGELILGDFP